MQLVNGFFSHLFQSVHQKRCNKQMWLESLPSSKLSSLSSKKYKCAATKNVWQLHHIHVADFMLSLFSLTPYLYKWAQYFLDYNLLEDMTVTTLVFASQFDYLFNLMQNLQMTIKIRGIY